MADELRQPLRRRRLGDRLRALKPSRLMLASVVAVVIGGGAGLWLALTPYPMAGEPLVKVKVAPLSDPAETASVTPDQAPPDEEALAADLAAAEAPSEPEITIVGSDEASLPRREDRQKLIMAPQKSVSQKGPFGLVPRIGKSGQTPLDVYAREIGETVLASDRPKIALLISGMGINAALTARAIAELPGDVSFAFAPYGSNLQSLVNEARANGHEVFLQVPMEPFGFPKVNPGERTLLSSPSDGANLDNLMWFMSRFSGYVGITNYMGARLAADDAALRPIIAEIKNRGLAFLDDGSLGGGLSPELGQALGSAAARSTRVIDAATGYEDIVANLKLLEDEARGGAIALGTGTGLAGTIEAVSGWSRDLAARGVVLVPVSALFRARSG